MKKQTPVLVTTAHKGVFFGYLESGPGKEVTLSRARNCIYWPQENKGFLGLAATGPLKGCRVGPPASTLQLFDVTSISSVEADAVQKWEAEPW